MRSRLKTRIGLLSLISTTAAIVGYSEGATPLSDPAKWEVVEPPAVTIGSGVEVEAGVDLFDVSGAVRLRDGRIAVANGARRVLLFGADGEYVDGSELEDAAWLT